MSKQRNRIFTNVYINNIDTSITEPTLRKLCEEKGGNVVSLVIIRDKHTKASLGYGFCSFATYQEAMRAVTNLGNYLLGSKRLTLSRASSRSERSSFLNSVRQQQQQQQDGTTDCANVYVKGLSAYEEEEGLRKMFLRFGEIINVRVMRNPQGKSRGFGFVSFKNVHDARKAVSEMNGAKVGSQLLGVSFYESKKVRSERLSHLHEASQKSVSSSSSSSFSTLNLCSSSSSSDVESESSESVEIMSDYSSNSGEESLSQSPIISPTLGPVTTSSIASSLTSSRTSSPCDDEMEQQQQRVVDTEMMRKNTILLSGLRFVSESKEICQIFYDFRNVRAEPVTSSRAVMSGEWKVSFESLNDAKRALDIVSQNLYVRNRKVSAKMLF